jgi:hypothetical protein
MLFQQYGNTATLSGTTTSSSGTVPKETNSMRVVNTGAVVIFVKTGNGSATATPVKAGDDVLLYKDPTHDTVAVITASSTATVYVAAGVTR